MKKLLVTALLAMCIVVGCGNGVDNNSVSKEEYDKVVAERDEMQNKQEEQANEQPIAKAEKELSVIDGLSFSEASNDKGKILTITSYIDSKMNVGDEFKKLGSKLVDMQQEEWFDYDYVIVQAWNENLGLIASIEANMDNMDMRSYDWYSGDNENDDSEETEPKTDTQQTSTVVYKDKRVKISYKEVNEDGVVFEVQNKTNANITIQADSVSINGVSTNDITMSDDVAPKSTGTVVARCSVDTSQKVKKIGGQLRIIDFNSSFDSYDATFVNVKVK